MATNRNASIFYYLQHHNGAIVWNFQLRRDVLDCQEALMAILLRVYGLHWVGKGADEMLWNLSNMVSFQVKSYYQALCDVVIPPLGKKFGKLMLPNKYYTT